MPFWTKRESRANLTPPLLKERCGERIMFRLSDTKAWDHCRLMGKDLRRA